jgi:hypothetical protein
MNNEEKNFGVPEVDNSPVGIVGMEGRLFRGMTGNKTNYEFLITFLSILAWFSYSLRLKMGR